MAENKKEVAKAKRGRPKKVATPPVSEEKEQLKMSSTDKTVTIKEIQQNLNQVYTRALGSQNSQFGFGSNSAYALFNPFLQNWRLKMLNSQPKAMSVEELTEAISSPQSSEQKLRSQGWSSSVSQYLYYRILRNATDIPLFKHYKLPQLLDKKEYEKDSFIEEDIYTDEWIKTFDIYNTFKRISLDVKREGKPTYVFRNSVYKDGSSRHVNYCTWQKLPTEYVKLTGIGQYGYMASFNMLLFMNPAFNIEQYPDFIKSMWYDMLEKGAVVQSQIHPNMVGSDSNVKYSVDLNAISNYRYSYEEFGETKEVGGVLQGVRSDGLKETTYMFWVQLPQKLCYTFCSDTSHPWAIPDTSGLFLGLQELTDYDTLAGLVASTPLTAILTGEIETIPNPNAGQDQTIMNPETVAGFQNQFNESTSTNVEALFVPVKNMRLQSLPNVPNSSEITTKATQNFITKAGESGVIVSTEKPSVSQVKGAQLLEESQCEFVTKQMQTILNMNINELIGCSYTWKVEIWGGIFSFDLEYKRAKEMLQNGGSFVLPKVASAFDMTLRDVKAAGSYVDSLGIYDDFKTLTQQTQAELKEKETNGEETRKVGRPSAAEEEIDNDNTEKSIDAGTNTSDMRDFAQHLHENCKCIICGSDTDGAILCDVCAEDFMEE